MINLKGKKLLILAGATVHCKVVEAAKKLGVYTIVTDYLETSPAKEIADEKWMLNITDVDAIVQKCQQENIDGILNFCIDPAQRPYQEICEKLQLPCYGNAYQFHIMTDKPSFKDFYLIFFKKYDIIIRGNQKTDRFSQKNENLLTFLKKNDIIYT